MCWDGGHNGHEEGAKPVLVKRNKTTKLAFWDNTPFDQAINIIWGIFQVLLCYLIPKFYRIWLFSHDSAVDVMM